MSDSNNSNPDENDKSNDINENPLASPEASPEASSEVSSEVSSEASPAKSPEKSINKSPVSIRSVSESASESADPAEVKEALNEFYRLKSKYETIFYDKYVKPIVTAKSKSKREKRVNYSKLPKPECVNCKRNVGSIFTIKSDANDFKRLFTAKCGDLADPCPFDITLEIADKQRMDKEAIIFNKELNDLKTEIVKGKNEMMFGYIEQNKAVAVFNINTEELKNKTEMAGYIINTNITINDNPKTTQLLKQLETEFGENLLLPFKGMIKEFNEGIGDRSKMLEAITFYKDEMMPKLSEIQRLKYKTDFVDFRSVAETKEETDLYFLVQRKNSLESLEFNFFSEDKIVANVKGVYEERSESSKTRRNREALVSPNNSTRKKRPLVELVEEKTVDFGSESSESVLEASPAESVAPNEEELYKKEYDDIYSRLSPKYKKILAEDEAWLQKTMDSFIKFNKLKRAGKTPYGADREFVHPDGLLLPPTQVSEDHYDYGHPVYNQILNPDNNIADPIQVRVLQTYLEPSLTSKAAPGSEYKQYLSTLADIVSNIVGFTKGM
jgi:hypothetical protein